MTGYLNILRIKTSCSPSPSSWLVSRDLVGAIVGTTDEQQVAELINVARIRKLE